MRVLFHSVAKIKKSDLAVMHPDISVAMIEKTLARLVRERYVK